jgi:hypothetical protein
MCLSLQMCPPLEPATHEVAARRLEPARCLKSVATRSGATTQPHRESTAENPLHPMQGEKGEEEVAPPPPSSVVSTGCAGAHLRWRCGGEEGLGSGGG